MNTNPVEAKVRKSNNGSTGLLIKAHDIVVQTEFGELASCEFPIWTSSPVPVEIPPGGTKSFVVGPFSGSVTQKAADGAFPNIVKFPVYREQGVASAAAFRELAGDASSQLLTKVPLVALATVVSGVVDGRLVQTHSVLPLWNDGSAVLVRLDWLAGDPAEGAPNPEWHMHASTGLPAKLGLEQLEQISRLPENATCCRYQIHMTPWLLGAQLLGDKGHEIEHPVWQREWPYEAFDAFSEALRRITGGLRGRVPSSTHRDAA